MPDDNAGGLPAAPVLTDPVMPVTDGSEPVAPPAPTLTNEPSTPVSTSPQKNPFEFNFDEPTTTSTPEPIAQPVSESPTPPAPPMDFMKPKLVDEIPLPPPPPTPPTPAAPPIPKPIPASLPPQPRSAAPVFIVLLLLICVVSIATAAFFWMQNQALISQIDTVQQTLEHRETPTITPAQPATPAATPTATVSAAPKMGLSAFTNIAAVVALAQTNSPTAQLLMITGDKLHDPALITFRYYFRRSPTNKTYIYVQQTGTKAPELFTQASVTPDNNIPDLAPTLVGGKGGLDSDSAWKLISENFLPTSVKSLTPTNISVMYLNTVPPNSPEITTPVLLWQFVIKYASIPDVVVQVNAVTQKLIYTNQALVTPTP